MSQRLAVTFLVASLALLVAACGPRPADDGTPPAHDLAGGPVQVGQLRVTLIASGQGRVKLRHISGGKAIDSDEVFWVRLKLENTSPTRKVDYHRWTSRAERKALDLAARVTDEHGKAYYVAKLPPDTSPVGRAKPDIFPGEPDEDVLTFEPLDDKAARLVLTLPRRRAGDDDEAGEVRVLVPRKYPAGQ